MDFRQRNELNKKMNILYEELYKPLSPSKNKYLLFVKGEKSEKIKNLNKLLSERKYVYNKPTKTIFSLIEETKRNNLNYKTFLKIDNYRHRRFMSDSNIKKVNDDIIFNPRKLINNNNLKNLKKKILKSPREIKNENLKEEILNNIKRKWDNNNSNFSTLNKSFKELETSIISSNKQIF